MSNIKTGTKREAINYLLNRSTFQRDLSLTELNAFQHDIYNKIEENAKIMEEDCAVLTFLDKDLFKIAQKYGIKLPDFFSIIIHQTAFWVSDNKGMMPYKIQCY